MLDAKPLTQPLPDSGWPDRLASLAGTLYLILALAAFTALPFLAIRWLVTPFTDAFLSAYATGLIFLTTSLWALRVRLQDPAARAFAVFSSSAGLGLATLFDLTATGRLVPLWTVSIAVGGAALLNLALLFPQESRLVSHLPYLRWLGYPLAGLLAVNTLVARPFLPPPPFEGANWGYETLFALSATIFFLGRTVWLRYASPSPVARAQSRFLLWGALLAFGPPAAGLASFALRPYTAFNSNLLLPLGLFPLTVGYSVLRYRLPDTNNLLSQTAQYTLLSILAAAGYTLFVGGIGLLLGQALPANNPFMVGLFAVLVAIAMLPARDRLQRVVDRFFFRGKSVYQERLQRFRQDLTHAVELTAVIRLLRKHITETLAPSQLHVFVRDPFSDQYAATGDATGRPTSDLQFSASSALAQMLSRRGAPFFMHRGVTMPRPLQADWARMALLGAQLFIPLPGRDKLAGWLSVGSRRPGDPYSENDLAYLEALGQQAALAIERAQVVADLEHRVHEMKVLARVAQGINVTLAYDDILELIYAQTRQVLALDDFRITLVDDASASHYHAFFVENDERLAERENRPLAERQGLGGEIIRRGRSLVTDDYGRECQNRAILPSAQGVFAWIGVPLNAGAETIGALNLGSRKASVVYSQEHSNFLQAIADQAAGAIAKARLLEETERRARQLATLNEVARSLASTLELGPLLDSILHSAVDILDCEAGSLLLVDEGSGELVFQVSAGPVASDLLGQRLPPGTGLAGKVADTGHPVFANNVHLDELWFGQMDQETGFLTRAILAVPLQVKERTIGVIEVINKRDGSPFLTEDQELLTVFTGQAAVAIENARLYTLTDQALAARVAELSVMQRVDRELNASLDMSHAMRITLDWATRQSGSDAGLVAVLSGESVRIMAAQGYLGDLETAAEANSLLHSPAVQMAIESGDPYVASPPPELEGVPSLPGALSLVVVPIRREARVIGLILLESLTAGYHSEEILQFLDRLSDHAAIAISNAQLYSEVQAANIAKSDFVSFVSHELKTPMTSIKGYADLLANEAVGPITEAQSNFLSTIRSNVDRMATLVSDLTDISRIEAGRLRLEFSAVSIPEVVEEVLRSTRQQVEEREQSLEVHIPEDLPAVWGDRTRIIQILTNLTSNAYKYTPRNGRITIAAERTSNRWDPDGAPVVVHISVQDTGIGISEADQNKIFQKFFRSEDQKAREVPGTGLGLSITKNLVEMQEGRIWFQSEYRVGTTFHFTIPVVATA